MEGFGCCATLVTMNGREAGSLGRLLGALILGVLVLAGTGLFAIQYHQQRSAAALAQMVEAGALLDQARSAQVGFKLQVQAWKNLLLRSRNVEAFAEQRTAFAAQESAVTQQLDALATAPGLPEALRDEARALHTEHQRVGDAYRTALSAYAPSDPATVFAVDTAVRGIDRGLDQRIDALAASIFEHARADANVLRSHGERDYNTLRNVVSGVAAAVILLSGALAWLAMRRTPQSRPA
jgi:methyl-accepting chemotaxis protein-1 (serine sensor receptor)